MRTVLALLLSGGVIASVPYARAADAVDTITANYLLQCQKDPNACLIFTNSTLRGLAQRPKACAPVPLNREQTSQLVGWILARPQQATGHATDDIVMAASALWPCK